MAFAWAQLPLLESILRMNPVQQSPQVLKQSHRPAWRFVPQQLFSVLRGFGSSSLFTQFRFEPYALDARAPSYFGVRLDLPRFWSSLTSKFGTAASTGSFKQVSTSRSEYKALSLRANR